MKFYIEGKLCCHGSGSEYSSFSKIMQKCLHSTRYITCSFAYFYLPIEDLNFMKELHVNCCHLAKKSLPEYFHNTRFANSL